MRTVRLLDADPDLGEGLDPRRYEEARARLTVPVRALPPGRWEPEPPAARSTPLGLLVLEGLMIRDVAVVRSTCAELVGYGEVIHPWHDLRAGGTIEADVHWRVLEPAELAVLDDRFVRAAGAYPEVVSALLLRAVARSQALAVSLAISCLTGLKLRLLAQLWHLADRFGRVGREGVSVPVTLTQEMLGQLVGATRPSVSTALAELEREGRISKRPRGGWILHGEPPDELRHVLDGQALSGG